MNNAPLCPECGDPLAAGVTEGLCAKCLLLQGLKLAAASPAREATASCDLPRAFGDYELLEEVARGGMGVIYRARQRSLGRIVAVKTLLFGPHANAEHVKRFRAEASAAASLQHPNIVAIHEVGVHQGEQYLAMDLVDGPNLAKFIRDEPLPAVRAASYLKTIADAVQYAHDKGILHRDLKPSNVLIDSNDQPRVTDFGLARRLDGDSSLTMSGHVLGSPSYMPPEQAGAGRHKVGRSSDVYSLGAMLYHMVVGRPPFSGETVNQTLEQVFHRDPVAPRLLNPAVPRDLETICLKCLEKEPARRYQNARALADELSRFLAGQSILARPVVWPEKVWRWCRRKPAMAALIALIHLVGLAGVGGILWAWRHAEERRVDLEENLYGENIYRANEALEDKDLSSARSFFDQISRSAEQRAMRGWEWRYLSERMQGDQEAVLETGDVPICDVAASPDGRYLACIRLDGRAKLWDFPSRTAITNWTAHGKPSEGPAGETPYAVAFSPDSRTLVTGGNDNRLCVWDLPSVRLRADVASPAGYLAMTRDGRTAASAGEFRGRVSLWNLSVEPPALLQSLESGLTVLGSMAFDLDGRTLLVAGPDGQFVRRFNISHPSGAIRLPNLEDSDGPIAVSPDGRWLATARVNELPFRIWALPSLQPVETNFVGNGRPSCLRFSPDSQSLALGFHDGRIVLWKRGAAKETATLLGHQKYLWQLAFSADGRTLASADQDNTVRLWDTERLERGTWSVGAQGTPHDVCFSPDSKRLVSISQLSTGVATTNEPDRWSITQLWRVDDRAGLIGEGSVTNAASYGLSFRVAFSPDGGLVAADLYTSLRFLSAPSLHDLGEVPGRLACWPTNGSWFAHFDPSGVVRGNSALAPARPLLPVHALNALAVSPDGNVLASCAGTAQWEIQLWNGKDGRPLGPPLGGHEGWVNWLGFSPDGRTLVSAGWGDGLLGIWDVPSRKLRAFLQGHNGTIRKAAFSPDGATLATCGTDSIVRLWNLARRQQLAALRGHEAPVKSVAFSPDGRWLASASADGTIRLWRAPTLEEIPPDRLAR